MPAPQQWLAAISPPRCTLCGEVIGVYEPLVYLTGKSARHTSRAAEPGIGSDGGACYHRACYERRSAGRINAA